MTPFRTRGVAVLSTIFLAHILVGCESSSNPVAPSSIQFTVTDIVVGSGVEATNGDNVSVDYAGWLYDPTRPQNKGVQFDSSEAQGFAFILGIGSVIAGWDQGVVGMRVGGVRQLLIPPELGYGAVGFGAIPPDATLVFDIELLNVQ